MRTENNIDDQANHCEASQKEEDREGDVGEGDVGEGDVGERDEETEAVDEAMNNDDEDGGDSWYPESSIPVQEINDEGISDEKKGSVEASILVKTAAGNVEWSFHCFHHYHLKKLLMTFKQDKL